MIRALILLLIATPAFCGGPLYRHQDPVVQKEFENAYQDIRTAGVSVSSATSAAGSAAASVTTLTSSMTAVNRLYSYRRPHLLYLDADSVQLSDNQTAISDVKVIFPDGDSRVCTTAACQVGKLSQTAILGTVGLRGGLRAGESRTANQWYATYVVKSTDSATQFTVVLSSVTPTQANSGTLNASFATNGWLYTGMIRNGDNSASTNVLLKFVMSGNVTIFYNAANAGSSGLGGHGIKFANVTGASNLTYSYSSGVGTTQIPSHLGLVQWVINVNMGSSGVWNSRTGATGIVEAAAYSTGNGQSQWWQVAVEGAYSEGTASSNHNIFLGGFMDNVLGVGANPQL